MRTRVCINAGGFEIVIVGTFLPGPIYSSLRQATADDVYKAETSCIYSNTGAYEEIYLASYL